ncbi:hypothetical protein ABID21_000518 [Pseudorhizobium tarimense]|uniref:NodB protein n=1 Tax=Pseudorhizobium tarimense TaxID=1079109 RepID=A0ABV2H1K1_9HYPH
MMMLSDDRLTDLELHECAIFQKSGFFMSIC